MKITIIMSLRDKNECLDNTLYSIKRQISEVTPHLCILDDASEQDPLPIIGRHFSSDQFTFFRNENPVGFQFLAAQMLDKVPEDSDYIIWQSCDVIWNGPGLLQSLIDNVKQAKRDLIFVPRVLNFAVPETAYEQGDDFFKYLKQLSGDRSLYGEHKKSSYSYLGMIKFDTFKKAVNSRVFNSDGVCDLTLSRIYPSLGVKFLEIDATAIHQTHRAIIYECTSINECTHECSIRRRMIKKGLKFPFDIGYYNVKTGRWDDHPDYH